eukprot:3654221-Rhodomonas_salina.1
MVCESGRVRGADGGHVRDTRRDAPTLRRSVPPHVLCLTPYVPCLMPYVPCLMCDAELGYGVFGTEPMESAACGPRRQVLGGRLWYFALLHAPTLWPYAVRGTDPGTVLYTMPLHYAPTLCAVLTLALCPYTMPCLVLACAMRGAALQHNAPDAMPYPNTSQDHHIATYSLPAPPSIHTHTLAPSPMPDLLINPNLSTLHPKP